jgi:DNA-binding LacI/PurR family transcriptional regulator
LPTAAASDDSLEELTCGLCDNVLIIGARFPLNIDRPDVVLIDCLESDATNSIQFDHAFAAETACNYLISQGRRQIALIHPQAAALPTRFCWATSTRWKKFSAV